ncbi:class I SAM-dependent methyltransferase [Halocatena pleomorpha]|uniref:Class I SAM-dependent methyltransferase n=1 Tax=Halocatena pleomorpha TaxID=1785090 RepID=A0A3P3R4I8_9EURY|nr:class I SAM-dependent methyltransferase [Halocatena pleomorpha]RRJ28265.1 class I SAM-dependent methyltransferase [Halocatena pleomorpha]
MVHPNRTDPETYYDEYGEQEWERLDRDFFHRLEWERLDRDFFHRLEWEGTVDQLDTHLPPSDPHHSPHVLDVGGGAGRYSIWLARRGYTVTLVDLSET